jgi:hypothetical protein
MAGYRAYRIYTGGTPDPDTPTPTDYNWLDSGLRKFHKGLYKKVEELFNGFKQVGDWEDVGTGWLDSEHTKEDYLSFRGYFSLDGTDTKQLKLYDHIITDGHWEQGGTLFWIDSLTMSDRFGVVKPNNSDLLFDGVYTYGEQVLYTGHNPDWSDVWYYDGYYHWLMVYVDDNDTVIGISAFQSYNEYYPEAYYVGGVMLFDRSNQLVYTTHSVFDGTPTPWIANYLGNYLEPKGNYVYTAKYIEGYGDDGALSLGLVTKDRVDNFVYFDNPFGVICLKNYDLAQRKNQVIKIGNQLYAHIGGGTNDCGLYLPIKEDIIEVPVYIGTDTAPWDHPDLPGRNT